MKKRIVVTGVGALTPIGPSAIESFNNAVNGVNGIGRITHFDASDFTVKIAGEVKSFDATKYISKKDARRIDLFSVYALAAADDAIKQSGLDLKNEDPYRIGVSVGAGIGGLSTIEKYNKALLERGQRGVSPFFIPMSVINMASGNIAIKWKIMGPNFSNVTACATGTHSIGLAARCIAYGDADVMICGGAEASITPLAISGFANMKALSTRNSEPQKASRPFDKDRDGFIVGEGAGVLVLESYEHAKARGADILAEFAGLGMSDDAYHITAPDPEGKGAVYAMKMALNDAEINASEVDYINAHGTSTHFNDLMETKAIKDVFKEHAYKTAISSTKSVTGHLLGAAGGVEAVLSVLSIKNGIIPPTMNLDNPGDGCDLFYVPNSAIKKDISVAMSNSFGFGGTNAVLIFKKFI